MHFNAGLPQEAFAHWCYVHKLKGRGKRNRDARMGHRVKEATVVQGRVQVGKDNTIGDYFAFSFPRKARTPHFRRGCLPALPQAWTGGPVNGVALKTRTSVKGLGEKKRGKGGKSRA